MKRIAPWLLLTLLIGALGGWAFARLVRPAPNVLSAPSFTLAKARDGTVGHSIVLNARVTWPSEATIVANGQGVVTAVYTQAGKPIVSGARLFDVDLFPVVAATGKIPMFRDLTVGARGDDVAQLQRFLTSIGYRVGADGKFGEGTKRAVTAWQKSLGLEPTGVVSATGLVFLPELPAYISLSENLKVGARITPGQELFRTLPSEPKFAISLPSGQAQLVAPGQRVSLKPVDADGAEKTWAAKVFTVNVEASESDPITWAHLGPVENGTICGQDCGAVVPGTSALIPATIEIVPKVSGVVVPVSAVATLADGSHVVVSADGTQRPVTVTAASSGSAVVGGIAAGDEVRAPALVPAK